MFQNPDKWKNSPQMTMGGMAIHTSMHMKNSQQNQHQYMNQAIASSVGSIQVNPSVIGSHPHITTNMMHTQLGPAIQNHAMGSGINMASIQNSPMMMPIQGMQNPQLGQQSLYELHASQMQALNGIGKGSEHLMYLSQAGMLGPGANQFLQQGQNQLGMSPVAPMRNQVSFFSIK